MSYQQLPPPTGVPYPGPPPKLPSKYVHDPLAVALGNASLLGLGYFLIRRWLFGVLGLIGTLLLVILLCSQREVGYEFALIAWGLLQVVHGWFLASRQPLRAANLTKRVVALGVTLLVFAGVAFERYDTHRIDQEAVASRDAGSCDGVRDAQAKYNLGHRIGDAPRTTRVETDVAACDRIDGAADKLRTARSTADVTGLQDGFNTLSSVLAQPNQEHTVKSALDDFLNGLPLKDSCQTLEVANWLRARTKAGNVLDQATAVLPRIEPAALLGCADALAVAKDWPSARTTYALVVTRYPHSKQADKARAGIKKADYEILQAKIRAELARVRGLVASGRYCATPARYSPAPRLRPGLNRAVFSGADTYVSKLPSQWKGTTADNAALVICAGEQSRGPAVRTCQYQGIKGFAGIRSVTFHKVAVPVTVYELRSGRPIKKSTLQISGSACPATISFTTYYGIGSPPSDMNVTPTPATIQEAFRPLVVR